mmetsp:Transcript_82614/g.233570  ORF Transcript_82614/g.233570 Transcript_82614/m.233570 type:complete len:166 (-) Transcript_82614:253-750(-)|eukprot:CAMPEP_0182533800 /NCGR_PEP_ID=MMETSP1323-20130603/14384_1 /TAXON_ID=236787 /ORGANISM="Florenciella parvula, Strain RCC1693" /LENGTH=165 /DNA_ID=CAMNT_0024743725 /DNA_START=54 /DNA_END=551 /DNA_ORIENTATION=+
MSGGGFGICGHKNTFSTGVRNGNWVEDQFGERLAARDLGSQTVMTQTVSQVSYVNPATMVSKADVGAPKMETDDTLRTGLSYNNLFKHGPANSANPVAMTDAGLERMRARAANLASVKRTTQERKPESSQYGSEQPLAVYKVRGPSAPAALPNFSRQSTFTKGEI